MLQLRQLAVLLAALSGLALWSLPGPPGAAPQGAQDPPEVQRAVAAYRDQPGPRAAADLLEAAIRIDAPREQRARLLHGQQPPAPRCDGDAGDDLGTSP